MEDLTEEPELEEVEEEDEDEDEDYDEDVEDIGNKVEANSTGSESSESVSDEDILVRPTPVRKSSVTKESYKNKNNIRNSGDNFDRIPNVQEIYPEMKLLETNFSVTGINKIKTDSYPTNDNRRFKIKDNNRVAKNNKNSVERPVSLNLQCL